jgi:hypothetical protein
MRVDCTQTCSEGRYLRPGGSVAGSTTTRAWPRPPGKADDRSMRVSLSSSGWPVTGTVVTETWRPGMGRRFSLRASARRPLWRSLRYSWKAVQSEGLTELTWTSSESKPTL